jgi:dihydroxy-acid dehydratase
VLAQITDLLELDALTVTGRTLGEEIDGATIVDDDVIRRRQAPFADTGGLIVLRGNLCPDGAVLKRSAATKRLLEHEGRAVVFEGVNDLHERIDDPDLEITADDILVLRNAGPIGAPGMPECGHLPIPTHLLKAGVQDMVRISDARMSGTGFGTVVLHVSPEAALGGPLSLVQTGDRIRLDAKSRRLDLLVSVEVLDERRRTMPVPVIPNERGYRGLYRRTVLQADRGCDLDFLVGSSPVEQVGRTY